MQATLLSLVQDIVSAIGEDEVDSITDTQVAEDVVRIIKRVYNHMSTQAYWPKRRKMIQLTGSGNSSYPTHMTCADSIGRIEWIKYDNRASGDTQREYLPVTYLEPGEFVEYLNGRNSDDTTVDIITDYDGVELLIKNNSSPLYYTSFDDVYIVFDAYDSVVGSTLVGARTQAEVYQEATFTSTDSFIVDLSDKLFDMLFQETLSIAFVEIKEVSNGKVEKLSREAKNTMSVEKHRIKPDTKVETPNYGR